MQMCKFANVHVCKCTNLQVCQAVPSLNVCQFFSVSTRLMAIGLVLSNWLCPQKKDISAVSALPGKTRYSPFQRVGAETAYEYITIDAEAKFTKTGALALAGFLFGANPPNVLKKSQ